MRKKEITLYKFSELSPEAQETALDHLRDINVDHEWWEYLYDDAKTAGIKITSFDLGNSKRITGEYLRDGEYTALAIIKNHGINCDTYKAASRYLTARAEILSRLQEDESGEESNGYEIDGEISDLDSDFLREILEEYFSILDQAYEHLTSDEAIRETIEANEYEFTEDGGMA